MSSTLIAAGTNATVYRANPATSVIDIHGELSGTSEDALVDAYARAVAEGAQRVVLNFADLEYMNSSGIGLLVTLLVRANRQGRQIVAVGLSDHYRNIFELTRLNEAIRVIGSLAEALA
jgi:anti-sigma B factor antagonist